MYPLLDTIIPVPSPNFSSLLLSNIELPVFFNFDIPTTLLVTSSILSASVLLLFVIFSSIYQISLVYER